MKVKVTTKKNDFKKLTKSLKALDKHSVEIGYLDGGEQAWLAAIHEYGCIIQVTPKMRAWLLVHGLALKPTTTTITIPERSFLRAGFDKYHNKVIKQCKDALADSLDSGDPDIFLDAVGLLMCDKIKDYAIALKKPPKHPFSLKMNPGKKNPLVITGEMIDALTYEVD